MSDDEKDVKRELLDRVIVTLSFRGPKCEGNHRGASVLRRVLHSCGRGNRGLSVGSHPHLDPERIFLRDLTKGGDLHVVALCVHPFFLHLHPPPPNAAHRHRGFS